MFCLGKVSLGAAIGLVAACGLGSSNAAFADSFQTYVMNQSDGNLFTAGLYSSGDAVLLNEKGFSTSYDTYSRGVLASSSPTKPAGPFDNGSACSVAFGQDTYSGVCNGAYSLFAVTELRPETAGIYIEHNGLFTSVSDGFYGISMAQLNASGDAVFDDLFREQYEQVYNTPTPEPGTWVMLLTGVGAAFVGQRRLFA